MFTDGSFLRSANAGGWAFRYVLNGKIYKDSGSIFDTTSNRMEMMAAIEGLDYILGRNHDTSKVTVFSDSNYLVSGAAVWMHDWKSRNWRTRRGSPVKNIDLWKEIDELSKELNHGIAWKWVRSHNGNPHNEAVDVAARKQATIMKRKIDHA